MSSRYKFPSWLSPVLVHTSSNTIHSRAGPAGRGNCHTQLINENVGRLTQEWYGTLESSQISENCGVLFGSDGVKVWWPHWQVGPSDFWMFIPLKKQAMHVHPSMLVPTMLTCHRFSCYTLEVVPHIVKQNSTATKLVCEVCWRWSLIFWMFIPLNKQAVHDVHPSMVLDHQCQL